MLAKTSENNPSNMSTLRYFAPVSIFGALHQSGLCASFEVEDIPAAERSQFSIDVSEVRSIFLGVFAVLVVSSVSIVRYLQLVTVW